MSKGQADIETAKHSIGVGLEYSNNSECISLLSHDDTNRSLQSDTASRVCVVMRRRNSSLANEVMLIASTDDSSC